LGCADAERAQAKPKRKAGPNPKVRKELLALCEPSTAGKLERDRTKDGAARLADLAQRLLDATQRATRRKLTDQKSLRGAARHGGSSYVATRFKVLEFLDATGSPGGTATAPVLSCGSSKQPGHKKAAPVKGRPFYLGTAHSKS
jgi:hypothetical protein